MGNIASFLASIPVPDLNWVGDLVAGLYSFVGNYGWTVVLFALILKLISLPLDFWQRCSAKKNAIKMEQMKPMMAKIDKAYGENKKGAQAEKNKLMKKFGYSMFSSCLPSLVTLVFFIIMFTGLTSYTMHANVKQYNDLVECYHYSIVVEADKAGLEIPESLAYTNEKFETGAWSDEKEAQFAIFLQETLGRSDKYEEIIESTKPAVGEFFEENRESFLWVKNIWRPDTWASVMPSYSEFTNGSLAMQGISGAQKVEYDVIYDAVATYAGGYAGEAWNGLLILPVLSAALSFLSLKISQKTSGQMNTDPTMQTSNKVMNVLMPLMMIFFVLMYTSALGVYFVSNSVFTILTSLALTPIVNRIYKNKDVSIIKQASYRR